MTLAVSARQQGSTARPGRLALDVSSLVWWVGTPTGMLRVEAELAGQALAAGDKIMLVAYDRRAGAYRRLDRRWAPHLLGWWARLDDGDLHEGAVKHGLARLLPSRYPLLMRLERRRLTSGSAAMRGLMDGLQRTILALRPAPFPLEAPGGRRLGLVHLRDALGPEIDWRPGDALFSPASDWWHKDLTVLRALAEGGVALSALCYDLIPLTHSHYYGSEDIERFRAYWETMFTHARSVIVNSHCIRQDVLAYCSRAGLPVGSVDVVPLACFDPVEPPASAPLPAGLAPGRFALFVSTIEPRKNHALLLAAWRRLCREGVPQRHGFKLVFVGRRGWMVDDVLREIDSPGAYADTLVHCERLDDAGLEQLYRACAFGLYPSRYEGFGLPVIEAYARGKAVIASTGGSLPEAVAGLSPCLDPDDVDGWTALLRRWIETPSERQVAEAQIAARFVRPSWAETADAMFAAALSRAGGGA